MVGWTERWTFGGNRICIGRMGQGCGHIVAAVKVYEGWAVSFGGKEVDQ